MFIDRRQRAISGEHLSLPDANSKDFKKKGIKVVTRHRPEGYERMRNIYSFVMGNYSGMEVGKKIRRMSTAEQLFSYTAIFLDPQFRIKAQEIQWSPGLPADIDQKRVFMLQRFYHDELAYHSMLTSAMTQYIVPLQCYHHAGVPIMSWTKIVDVFSNLEDIIDVSTRLVNELKTNIPISLLNDSSDKVKVKSDKIAALSREFGIAFQVIGKQLEVYSVFVSNYKRAVKQIRKLITTNERVRDFFEAKFQVVGMRVYQVLGLPLVRFEQYLLALEDLRDTFKNEKVNVKTFHLLRDASEAVSRTMRKTLSPVMNIEARFAVAYIQEALFKGSIGLVTDTRYFIRAGYMNKVWNKQSMKIRKGKKYMFFLFNDILIYSTCFQEKYKLKHIISLVNMKVYDIEDEPKKQKFKFRIDSVGNQKSFQVSADSLNAKYSWMAAIRTCVVRATEHFKGNYIKPDEVESIIKRPKKASNSRLGNGWVEVRNEHNLWYFYQRKTGICSLAQICYRRDIDPSDNPENIPYLLSSIQFRKCEHSDCSRQALMMSTLCYCSLHLPIPNIKDLLPGGDKDEYNDSFFFDDKLPSLFDIALDSRKKSISSHVSYGAELGDSNKPSIAHIPDSSESFEEKQESEEMDPAILIDSESDDDEILPPPPSSPPSVVWRKLWSEEYKQDYYWNSKSGKTTWAKPNDYVE